MLFENNSYDYDILSLAGLNFNSMQNYDSKEDLLNSELGFRRGNMWNNEYVPYKNMEPVKVVPTSERESLLYKIMEIDFAINDLNLFLDLHPDNQRIYEVFKKYTEECIYLKDKYAKEFGPLTLENTSANTYEWIKNPWPWDKGGSKYV